MKEEKQIISDALTGLVKRLAMSLECGFIQENALTVGQIFEIAKLHAKGQFGVDLPLLSEIVNESVADKAYTGNWKSIAESDEHTKLSLGTSCLVRLDCGNDETIVVSANVVNGKFWSLDELRKHRHGGEPYKNVIEWSLLPAHYKQLVYVPIQNFISREEALDALKSGKTITHTTYAGGEHLSLAGESMIQIGDNPTERVKAESLLNMIKKDERLADDWLVLQSV